MKNIIFLVLINFVFIGFINSQTREKQVIDNFIINNGLTVISQVKSTEAVVPIVSQVKKADEKSLSQKNNQPADKKSSEKTGIAGKNLVGFTTGDAAVDSYIVEYSALHNVDPLLIYAQMHQESGFKRQATSYKGASGLMQLMPGTATRFGVRNIYDPKQNISAGIKYMRWLMDKFNGDVNLALAGYNAGEGAVMKYGWQIPPYRETQAYVKRISAHYSSIKKSVVEVKSNKPLPKIAQAQLTQPAASSKFEQRAVTIQLSNGKTAFSNF